MEQESRKKKKKTWTILGLSLAAAIVVGAPVGYFVTQAITRNDGPSGIAISKPQLQTADDVSNVGARRWAFNFRNTNLQGKIAMLKNVSNFDFNRVSKLEADAINNGSSVSLKIELNNGYYFENNDSNAFTEIQLTGFAQAVESHLTFRSVTMDQTFTSFQTLFNAKKTIQEKLSMLSWNTNVGLALTSSMIKSMDVSLGANGKVYTTISLNDGYAFNSSNVTNEKTQVAEIVLPQSITYNINALTLINTKLTPAQLETAFSALPLTGKIALFAPVAGVDNDLIDIWHGIASVTTLEPNATAGTIKIRVSLKDGYKFAGTTKVSVKDFTISGLTKSS